MAAFPLQRESVIAGVCFSHFFMRFAREGGGRGLALVRISGMSVIARCAQRGESTVN